MIRLVRSVSMVAAIAAAIPAAAQSLGDLARQEEARRAGSRPVKSFSNADLKPSEIVAPASLVSPASSANCYMSISLGRCVTAEDLLVQSARYVPKEVAAQESDWRKEAEQIRAPLLQLQFEAGELAATAENEARSASERAWAAKELARIQSTIQKAERRWHKFAREAELRQVPRAWLEPIPELSPENPQQQ